MPFFEKQISHEPDNGESEKSHEPVKKTAKPKKAPLRFCGDCPHLVRTTAIRKRVGDSSGAFDHFCAHPSQSLDSNLPGAWLGFRDRRLDECNDYMRDRHHSFLLPETDIIEEFKKLIEEK
jgi:hypothetical protein